MVYAILGLLEFWYATLFYIQPSALKFQLLKCPIREECIIEMLRPYGGNLIRKIAAYSEPVKALFSD